LHKNGGGVLFYLNFVRLCNSIGKSPSAVAEDMGLQRSSVTRWANGSAPRKATVEKIATYFGVDSKELTGESEQKEKPSTPEDVEREAHGQAILDKYNMLDPATQAMFESMLDAAIASQEKKNGH
jgi:transcriptional regulator with XRE-family HTH domain